LQAALKLPHAAINIEFEAQHCASPAHCDGFAKGSHRAPSGSVPAGAVGRDGVIVVDDDMVDDMKLQPSTTMHCWPDGY
jgi:hypothetical protein